MERRAATVVVALMVAGLIGSVLVVTRDGRQSDAVTTDDGVERGEVRPLFLLPSHLPNGLVPEGSWGGEAPDLEGATLRSGEWTSIQRWARLSEDGTPIDVLDVSWGTVRGGGDPLAPYRSDARPLQVRGHDALLSRDGTRLVWAEPELGVVMVTGSTAPPTLDTGGAPPLPLELLEAVAEDLEIRPDAGVEVSAPPPGFEYLAEWPGMASEGKNPRAARYAGPGGRVQVQLVDDSEVPPELDLGTAAARRITVRGQLGVLTPALVGPLSTGSTEVEPFVGERNVQWVEPSGERVTVSADGLGESDLLALAEGLERVDDAAWRALNQPVTSTTAPSTTTSPSTTVPPADASPDVVQVRGTYQGLEHFELFAGPCAVLSHELESTFELDSGETWQFRSDYCGTVEGDVWTGAGTFTFTTADGSTITGVTSNSARLPSTGEPYDLRVTDGTGAFAGATGSCALDNHLRATRFGEQEQYGTFSCEITRQPADGGVGAASTAA